MTVLAVPRSMATSPPPRNEPARLRRRCLVRTMAATPYCGMSCGAPGRPLPEVLVFLLRRPAWGVVVVAAPALTGADHGGHTLWRHNMWSTRKTISGGARVPPAAAGVGRGRRRRDGADRLRRHPRAASRAVRGRRLAGGRPVGLRAPAELG